MSLLLYAASRALTRFEPALVRRTLPLSNQKRGGLIDPASSAAIFFKDASGGAERTARLIHALKKCSSIPR